MADFGELTREISGLLLQSNNGLVDTEIKQAINDAIDFHQTKRFDFNDGEDVITTAAGVDNYALPSDFHAVTHARLDRGGALFQPLNYRSWEWFLEATSNGSTTTRNFPTDFVIRGRRLYLFPTPTNGLPLELYYIRKLAPFPLSNDDDQNAWTNEARLVIRSRALYDLYLNQAQQPDHASAQLQFERDAIKIVEDPASFNTGGRGIRGYRF